MAQKKYTVLHHDDTHFLMQHPNGSNFKVAKRNLDPRTASEIQKMSDGGEAVPDPTAGLEKPDTAIEDIYSALSSKAPAPPAMQNPWGPEGQHSPIDKMLADGKLNWEQASKLVDSDNAQNKMDATPVPQGAPEAPEAPKATSAESKETPSARTPGSAEVVPGAPAAGGSDLYDFEKQQLRGVDAQARAQAEQGRQQAVVYDALATNLQRADNDFKEKHAKYTERSERLMQEVYDGKIDPNQYWENKGTSGKVSAAIGIALAGIGGGMSGQGGNVALDVINKAIDRDIDAQKSNLSNKNSLLSKNLEMTHDLESAAAMTKSNMLAVATAQIGKIAGDNAGPMAMAMRDQLQGQLKEHYKTINLGLAQNDAQMAFMKGLESDVKGGKQIDPSMYIRYRVPEKDRHKAAEELDRVQKFNDRSENILRLFDEAANDNTAVKTGAGFLRTPPSVSALNVELESLAKDKDGRVNEMVLRDMKKMAPSSGNLGSTTKDKRANMVRMLQEGSTSAILDSYRVPYRKAPSEAPKTKTVNGVKFMRGPNGEAIPVK